MEKKTIREPEKHVPVIADYDVLICGGGVAGVAAALSAARNGMSVGIVEKNYGFGGLATLGLICDFLPLCDGAGHQVIGGIAEEFFFAAAKKGAERLPDCWLDPEGSKEERIKHRLRMHFTPACFQLELDYLVSQAKIDVLFDTRLCAIVREGNRVAGAIVENKSGRNAIVCKAMVDATGDADAVYLAGERTEALHDNRRSGWFYTKEGADVRLYIVGDPFFQPVPEGAPVFSGDDAGSVTAFCLNARQMIREKMKEINELPGKEGAIPLILPSIPQMRKTRRLAGIGELTVEDRKYHEDTIGMAGYYRTPGTILCIPYRALVCKTVENLFAAGRCISCREDAWNITRGIPSSSITGQAAGTAAALCVIEKTSAQQLDVTRLRHTLRAQGVRLDLPPTA